jgi:hypothetical protein
MLLFGSFQLHGHNLNRGNQIFPEDPLRRMLLVKEFEELGEKLTQLKSGY